MRQHCRLLLSRLLLPALLLLPLAAWGFGAKGHRASALLAEELLDEDARAALHVLLSGESLPEISTWADEMRSSPDNERFWGYDHAASWHFVNIPEGLDYAGSRKNPAGDALSALQASLAILRDEAVPAGPVKEGLELYLGRDFQRRDPEGAKRLALRFLVHLVADLHQPLHVGYEEDRGGNGIRVRWEGRTSNLHRVWDSQLLDATNLSWPVLGERLAAMLEDLPASERRAIAAAAPEDWLAEGLVLRRQVYDPASYRGDLGAAYARRFGPLAEEQLMKAALRLAALLNELF